MDQSENLFYRTADISSAVTTKLQRYGVWETHEGIDFRQDDSAYWVKGPEADAEIERLGTEVERLRRENSEMGMKLAMIATGCWRGDVQEFADGRTRLR